MTKEEQRNTAAGTTSPTVPASSLTAVDAICKNSENCFLTNGFNTVPNVRTCSGRPNLMACFALSD